MDWSAKKKILSFLKREWKSLLILSIILFLGNNLREFSYAQVPNPGETRDEYSFGWLGLSLIKDKFPIAWSGISAYPVSDFQKINVDHIYDSNSNLEPFPINSPWFDHPPAFGLLVGGYAYAKGVRTFEDTSVIILRRPMLKIGIINTILIFFLSYLLFGNKIALFSALLYSVIPTTVISSRLALAENGYLPLFLLSLIFAIVYFRSKKYIYWILASIIAGAAILFKLSAVSVFITLVFLSFSFGGKDKFKLLKTLLFYLLLFGGVYLLYGAYFGWEQFVKVIFANSSRFYGASSEVLFQAFTQSKITKNLSDGWILLGWISFITVALMQKKKDLGIFVIAASVFSYFLVFIIFGSEAYGSYRIPFYPFLVISTAYLIVNLFRSGNLMLLFILLLLPFGTSLHRLIGVVAFQNYVSVFRLFTVLVFLLFFINSFIENPGIKRMQGILMYLMLLFVVWLSIKEIYFYTIDKWYFAT